MACNLKGLRAETLKDMYLNVDKLVNEYKDNAEELRKIVSLTNNPQLDAFDSSIRLIIVDKGQLRDELQQILFENDQGVIKRALRCKWFFYSTPLAFFTETLLPVVSVSTRHKVITVLGKSIKNEEHSLELFNWIRNRFGLRTAEPILAGCPLDFISKIVLTKTFFVKDRTFNAVTKRSPELGVEMTRHFLGREFTIPKPALKIFLQNPHLFSSWDNKSLIKLHILSKIGRQRFKLWQPRMITMDRRVMFSMSELLRKRLFNSMSYEERVEFLVSVVAHEISFKRITLKNWLQNLEPIYLIIKYLDSLSREKLLYDTFKSVYGLELWEAREACIPKLLEMISSSKRAELLEAHKFTEDEYIYLYPADQSIHKLIQKIKKTAEPSDRCQLLNYMISNCILAKDYQQLLTVFEFIQENYQDNPTALKTSLKVLIPLASQLPMNIMQHITLVINDSLSENNCDTEFLYFFEEYLSHCIKNDISIDVAFKAFKKYFITLLKGRHFGIMVVLKKLKSPQAKKIYELLYKSLPSIGDELDDMNDLLLLIFLNTGNKIDLDLTDMEDKGIYIFKLIDSLNYNVNELLTDFIWAQKGIVKKYNGLNILKLISNRPYLIDLLKLRPNFVKENVSIILDCLKDWPFHQSRFFRSSRLLTFFKLNDLIEKYCLENFTKQTKHILYIYSFIASIENYRKIANMCFLENGCVDIKFNNNSLLVDVVINFHHLKPYNELFLLSSNCLIGGNELFYPALRAFHKACYNVPSKVTMKHILPLLNSPVSVFKKAVAIIPDVCPQNESLKYFEDLWKTAKHYSARTVLLQQVHKLFVNDPSSETYRVLNIFLLDSDQTLVLFFPSLELIPDTFIDNYANTVWDVLNKFSTNHDVDKAKNRFLMEISKKSNCISSDLSQFILKQTLFLSKNINKFAIGYLVNGPNSLSHRVNYLKELFDERIGNAKEIIEFIRFLINQNDFIVPFEIFDHFIKVFKESFNRFELYEARLLILCFEHIYKVVDFNENELSKIGLEISKMFVSEPDYSYLIPIFNKTLSDVVKYNARVGVISGFDLSNAVLCMIALDILPKLAFTYENVFGKDEVIVYNLDEKKVLELLRSIALCKDPSVQMSLKIYLMQQNI